MNRKKPLSPSDRNNGSQVYKMDKWALRKQTGLKNPRKRGIANPWVVYDVEKWEWATVGPKLCKQRK